MSDALWIASHPLAHRGLFGEAAPENSRESIIAAIDAGFGVEIDVRASSDGTPWLSHDASLLRTCGVDAKIAACGDRRLSSVARSGDGLPMIRLDEAASIVANSDSVALIEVKPVRHRRRLLENVLAISERFPSNVAIESFDPTIVSWFRRHASVPVGQLLGLGREFRAPGIVRRGLDEPSYLSYVKPQFLAMNVDVYRPGEAAEFAERLRLPLLLWTIRDPATLDAARSVGANVIFESSSGLGQGAGA